MSDVPPIPGWFQDGFHRFLGPFLKRHFHTVAVHRDSLPAIESTHDRPLIVYGNHPSWWDPLIAQFLCRQLFAPRQFYAPIDARALEQYQVFRKLGFFGIDLESRAGASAFLKTSQAIVQHTDASLWITPEGRFCDVRDASAPLMPGLAHLATKLPPQGTILALALEYVFWDERLPVVLARFAQPLEADSHRTKPEWNEQLTQQLRTNQSELAVAAQARRAEPFEPLLRGTRGAGGVYDTFRRFKSMATRRRFRASHGEEFH